MIKVINKEVEQLVKIPAIVLELDLDSAMILTCILGATTTESIKVNIRNSSVPNPRELCAIAEERKTNRILYDGLYRVVYSRSL